MMKVGGPPVVILAAARGQHRGKRKGAKQCVAPHLPGGPHRQPVRAWRCSRATPPPGQRASVVHPRHDPSRLGATSVVTPVV